MMAISRGYFGAVRTVPSPYPIAVHTPGQNSGEMLDFGGTHCWNHAKMIRFQQPWVFGLHHCSFWGTKWDTDCLILRFPRKSARAQSVTWIGLASGEIIWIRKAPKVGGRRCFTHSCVLMFELFNFKWLYFHANCTCCICIYPFYIQRK